MWTVEKLNSLCTRKLFGRPGGWVGGFTFYILQLVGLAKMWNELMLTEIWDELMLPRDTRDQHTFHSFMLLHKMFVSVVAYCFEDYT